MDDNWSESYHHDVINMTYQDLVKRIGEPHYFERWDIETQCQWLFELGDLTHFRIYDWKEGECDRHVTDGNIVEWHIGHDGKPGTIEKVKAWLHSKGVGVDKSAYYKYYKRN